MNEDQQSYFGLNGNEENELQKKRDNWVYIKNYNNDVKQVWVIFRCSNVIIYHVPPSNV